MPGMLLNLTQLSSSPSDPSAYPAIGPAAVGPLSSYLISAFGGVPNCSPDILRSEAAPPAVGEASFRALLPFPSRAARPRFPLEPSPFSGFGTRRNAELNLSGPLST
jgi:hypothetical protein